MTELNRIAPVIRPEVSECSSAGKACRVKENLLLVI